MSQQELLRQVAETLKRLDMAYILHWIHELELLELWQRLTDEAEPIR